MFNCWQRNLSLLNPPTIVEFAISKPTAYSADILLVLTNIHKLDSESKNPVFESTMALQVLECGVCLGDICSKPTRPHVIDETLICYDCLKESILPMFQAALKYEHHYPPRFGPKKLEIDDFVGLLSRHFEIEFVERYVRREIEYAATIRIYCKNLVDTRHLPAVGGVCQRNTKLALTPGMVETYKAAGNTQTECGGFVSGRVRPPNTILECEKCNGKLCGACEEPIFRDIVSHTCKAVHRADTLQDLIGQRRGRDIQQCPNTECRSITGLSSGCNQVTCNRCSTFYCFICGQEADPDGDHWIVGNPCPRWNQPGSHNAQHDEPGPPETPEEMTFDDPQWGEVLRQLRFVVMHRLENGVRVEHEWVLQALRNVNETECMNEQELIPLVMLMFPPLAEIEPRPQRAPGEITLIMSPAGIDEAAQRAIDWVLSVDPSTELPRTWYANLTAELEHRQLVEHEFVILEADLRPSLQSVMRSYEEGLFEVRAIDASPEINAWATVNGYDLDDEPVVRLMRMYDDLAANIEFADRVADTHTSPEETEEFHHRHTAIIQEARRGDRDLIDGALPELKAIYDDYMGSIPAWQWY